MILDSFDQLLSIPRISKDTNFWMVRAKRGFFFDEFLRKEYIAIHLWGQANGHIPCADKRRNQCP